MSLIATTDPNAWQAQTRQAFRVPILKLGEKCRTDPSLTPALRSLVATETAVIQVGKAIRSDDKTMLAAVKGVLDRPLAEIPLPVRQVMSTLLGDRAQAISPNSDAAKAITGTRLYLSGHDAQKHTALAAIARHTQSGGVIAPAVVRRVESRSNASNAGLQGIRVSVGIR